MTKRGLTFFLEHFSKGNFGYHDRVQIPKGFLETDLWIPRELTYSEKKISLKKKDNEIGLFVNIWFTFLRDISLSYKSVQYVLWVLSSFLAL